MTVWYHNMSRVALVGQITRWKVVEKPSKHGILAILVTKRLRRQLWPAVMGLGQDGGGLRHCIFGGSLPPVALLISLLSLLSLLSLGGVARGFGAAPPTFRGLKRELGTCFKKRELGTCSSLDGHRHGEEVEVRRRSSFHIPLQLSSAGP